MAMGQPRFASRDLQRRLFAQPFEINAHTCNHQVYPVRRLRESLVEVAKRVAVEASQRIGWHDAKPHFVCDYKKDFARSERLRSGEQLFDFPQGGFIEQYACAVLSCFALVLHCCLSEEIV